MTNRAFDFLGLVVLSVIIAILARRPQVVTSFFGGLTKLSGVALQSGS